LASLLKLQPAEAGANVMLLLLFDDVAFERTSDRDSPTFAAQATAAAAAVGTRMDDVMIPRVTAPGRRAKSAVLYCLESHLHQENDES